MIQTPEHVIRTHEALGHLVAGLAYLREKKDQMHPDRYLLQAEAPVYEILKLRRQIDEYLGIPELAAHFAADWAAMEAEEASERAARAAAG